MSALEEVLSPAGWAYASTTSTEEGDPGRFHGLFGRDSLIVALQVLPERPDVAEVTLRAHAALQGTRLDPEIDEEPGKIIHEYRQVAPQWLVDAGWPVRHGTLRYYGTADATSWFLVVLAALGDGELAAEIEPVWRAAAGWLTRALDRGDGLVRHGPRVGPGGLTQQGWRDAYHPERDADGGGGGILRLDGTAPDAPLADADSQAAALAALRALAVVDARRAAQWRERAAALRSRIGEVFGPDVMAVEPGDVVVPGAGSQLGWLLWAGAFEGGAARAVAERLTAPDVRTPFGLRTLSSEHPRFLPHGYHRGAIWPFDSWFGWGGLRAAGFTDSAEQVRSGVLAALDELGKAPELYAVTTAGQLEPISIANRVQAWTIGARSALIRGWDGRS